MRVRERSEGDRLVGRLEVAVQVVGPTRAHEHDRLRGPDGAAGDPVPAGKTGREVVHAAVSAAGVARIARIDETELMTDLVCGGLPHVRDGKGAGVAVGRSGNSWAEGVESSHLWFGSGRFALNTQT